MQDRSILFHLDNWIFDLLIFSFRVLSLKVLVRQRETLYVDFCGGRASEFAYYLIDVVCGKKK